VLLLPWPHYYVSFFFSLLIFFSLPDFPDPLPALDLPRFPEVPDRLYIFYSSSGHFVAPVLVSLRGFGPLWFKLEAFTELATLFWAFALSSGSVLCSTPTNFPSGSLSQALSLFPLVTSSSSTTNQQFEGSFCRPPHRPQYSPRETKGQETETISEITSLFSRQLRAFCLGIKLAFSLRSSLLPPRSLMMASYL